MYENEGYEQLDGFWGDRWNDLKRGASWVKDKVSDGAPNTGSFIPPDQQYPPGYRPPIAPFVPPESGTRFPFSPPMAPKPLNPWGYPPPVLKAAVPYAALPQATSQGGGNNMALLAAVAVGAYLIAKK